MPERPRNHLERILTFALILAIALAFHGWLASGLDLRGIPGACAPPLVHSLAVDGWSRSEWSVRLLQVCLPFFGGDALLAARVATIVSGLCAVLGAMLAAWSLLGRRAAVGTGLVAAIWSQSAYIWLMIGADAMAWGLSWLGIGVAWVSARRGPLGLVGVLVGAALALMGAAVKFTALPAAAFLFIAPLLVEGQRRKRRAGAITCGLVAAVGIAYVAFRPVLDGGYVDAPLGISPRLLLSGAVVLVETMMMEPEGLVFGALGGLALVGALLPSRGPTLGRWPQRAALAVLGIVVVAFTGHTLDDKIRGRFLVVTSFPIIVLAGCATAVVQRAVERAISIGPLERWRVLGWLVPCAVVSLLLQDTLGFTHAWSRLRETKEGANPSSLPHPASVWEEHYRSLSPISLQDVSGIGGIDLAALGTSAPDAGVLVVPLRDEREFILLAHAALAGKTNVQLDPDVCCDDPTLLAACAMDLVTQVDEAGARLVLPYSEGQGSRGNIEDGKFSEWTALLIEEAGESLVRDGRWWLVMDGSGQGGPTPCASRQLWTQRHPSRSP